MAKAQIAYLYVISSDDVSGPDRWVKIGRSAKPLQRKAQLQVGNGAKLQVRGQYPVPASEAAIREQVLKAVLRPLRIKGEVFYANNSLACAITKWIANGNEPDDLIRVAVSRYAAGREWERLMQLPRAGGRWANAEILAAAEKVYDEYIALTKNLESLDKVRVDELDPIMAAIREPCSEPKRRGVRREKIGGSVA